MRAPPGFKTAKTAVHNRPRFTAFASLLEILPLAFRSTNIGNYAVERMYVPPLFHFGDRSPRFSAGIFTDVFIELRRI